MVTLYDQFNRPIQRPEKKPDRRPLGAAPLTNAWRDYVADGMTPERLAAVLRQADAGDLRRQAELYDQMEERDGHILGETSKRRNVILDADAQVIPASDDAKDKTIAEAVEQAIDDIADWPDVLVSLQDSVGKGFSPFELHWDYSEGQTVVENFEFIEQKRFLFTDKRGLLSTIPRLITDDAPMGIDIPHWRVMMHRYGGKSGHVVRSGIYRICAWWWLFKNFAVKDWVVFAEVYGMPLRIGKYDSGASEDDRRALEIAVQMLGSDAAGVISKATEIELITGNSGSVSSDIYERLAKFANREMSKALLGSTLTAESDGKGSYALGNVHNDVRIDLINADGRAIASTIRNQFIRPFVGFNFGWDASVPKYELKFHKEDLKEHMEVLDKFADRMPIPVSHVRKKWGIPEPEDGEEILQSKIAPVSAAKDKPPHYITGAQKITRNEDLGFLGMVLEQLGELTDTPVENLVGVVRKIMMQSASLTELRDNLADAFLELDSNDLGSLIAGAMNASLLAGRYEAGNA